MKAIEPEGHVQRACKRTNEEPDARERPRLFLQDSQNDIGFSGGRTPAFYLNNLEQGASWAERNCEVVCPDLLRPTTNARPFQHVTLAPRSRAVVDFAITDTSISKKKLILNSHLINFVPPTVMLSNLRVELSREEDIPRLMELVVPAFEDDRYSQLVGDTNRPRNL